jgi:chromosome partitioning protein
MDWVVVRNRLSPTRTRNRQKLTRGLKELAERVGCRIAEGIGERVVFRELFPRGLTALDALDRKTLGGEPTLSHVSAREEIRALIDTLNLLPKGANRPDSGPRAHRGRRPPPLRPGR